MRARHLENRIAYIPAQCFTKTIGADRRVHNPCYVCHRRSEPPNYTNDDNLQLSLTFPVPGSTNPWTNLFDPPLARAPRWSDDDVLRYVRSSNYVDDRGDLTLPRRLDHPPPDWDGDGNGRWDGYRPDVWFRFDDRGFDHLPNGSFSGWRAFAYYPFPGTFFPTNGSTDDVLIRLAPVLQQDAAGAFDASIYAMNLAVVEALIVGADVPIEATDERGLGVDLDLDGRLGRAERVAFDAARDGSGRTRMHYVGRAREEERSGRLGIAPGLFPIGTEFFHSVRYLDVADGRVAMAARFKELRYTRKVEWLTYAQLKARSETEALEQQQSTDGVREILWGREQGINNGQGWVLQAFIEDRDGELRPQWFEEMAACMGCHGGIGATTDSIFSLSRKLRGRDVPRGWFHWSQRDLRGLPEPRLRDGRYEYTLYLAQAGAGDELRENREVIERFFDERHKLRSAEVDQLHRDITHLLLPSAERALALDRAYRAVVSEQSFAKGRDAVLAPSENVYASPPRSAETGIVTPVR
jgi:hypothetical protein